MKTTKDYNRYDALLVVGRILFFYAVIRTVIIMTSRYSQEFYTIPLHDMYFWGFILGLSHWFTLSIVIMWFAHRKSTMNYWWGSKNQTR